MFIFIKISLCLLLLSGCFSLEHGQSVEFYLSAANLTGLPGGTGGYFYSFEEGALNHNPPQTIWFKKNFTYSGIVANNNPVWDFESHKIQKIYIPWVVYGIYRLQFYEKMEDGRNVSISGYWEESTALLDLVETSCKTSSPYKYTFRYFTCYLHCTRGPV